MFNYEDRLTWLLLVGIGIFNKIDYFLTTHFVGMGFRELNPLMKPIVETMTFSLLKLAVVPLLLIVLWKIRHKMGSQLVQYLTLPFMGYLGLMVYFRVYLL